MKVIVAGKNNIAVDVAKALLNRDDIEGLYSIFNSNDDGVDRHQRSFKKYCLSQGIDSITLEEAYLIEGAIFLSLEFDKIIEPERFIDCTLYNIHFSKLPEYKGMYTSALPIMHNKSQTGVTFHFIDSGIDTGDIIYQNIIDIDKDETAKSLYQKYIKYGTDIIISNFDDILSGSCVGYRQDSESSSYYSKKAIDYSSISVDLRKTGIEIKRMVDALTFRDYQLPSIKGIKVCGCEVLFSKSIKKPGEIVNDTDVYLILSTIDYDIKLYKDNVTNLMGSVISGDLEKTTKFINSFNVNEKDDNGWSPIIVATYYGHLDLIKLLISFGANINDFNRNGTTVFMYAKNYALKNHDYSYLKEIISLGADVYQKDYNELDVFDYVRMTNIKKDIDFIETFR
ncbi:formyltransferase family protein [Vibrio splendidus]|uniref:formyltransferase family protein n=1 Tax=Vibrio splendidus TaxID=29497 RepID=UPI0021B1970E|nr:formyltransferase family protein [Vibrio splendidus]UWZ97315.1 ankyrin repeat domain-containing protein [Vibrio splendidus]